jgi:PiT family inorganic phosphate transporter
MVVWTACVRSHTLIGSVIGVGIANQLMNARTATSGVDWGQAANIGKSLLLSPIVGFGCAYLLLLVAKALIKDPKLYKAPEGTEPPPFYIRCLLILPAPGSASSTDRMTAKREWN